MAIKCLIVLRQLVVASVVNKRRNYAYIAIVSIIADEKQYRPVVRQKKSLEAVFNISLIKYLIVVHWAKEWLKGIY